MQNILCPAPSCAINKMLNANSGASSISGVYTYIGQMIAHDIVPNTNRLSASMDVTSDLNLDSLYGNSPLYSYQFPDAHPIFFENHRFKLHKISEVIDGKAYSITDFPRDIQTKNNHRIFPAIIPEARNDENVIVAQLHLLFLKFHNLLVDYKMAANALEARQFVTLVFQKIVISEFLESFLHKEVFRVYFGNSCSPLSLLGVNGVPKYFSHAAFRFGHSGVRKSYTIRDYTTSKMKLKLHEMFKKSIPLTPSNNINWDHFFLTNPEDGERLNDNHALKIDTNISEGMGLINNSSHVFPTANIVERNLNASCDSSLISGFEMYLKLATEINRQNMSEDLPLEFVCSLSNSNISGLGVTSKSLTLWPYILLEAEKTQKGNKLGVMGSILVAEVLRKAIQSSQFSMYENGSCQISSKAKAKFNFLAANLSFDFRNSPKKSLIQQIQDVTCQKKEKTC